MTYYPDTPVPPSPSPACSSIDCIIYGLWNRHLELELSVGTECAKTIQHLDITAAVIDFWEEKITEINRHEIQQRRSNSNKNA